MVCAIRSWTVRCVVVAAVTAIGGSACGFTVSSGERQPMVVFVVHGTYGGAEDWVKLVDGKITFASELKRGLGSDAEIVPFLWRTSVRHEVRVAAAERLAAELDRTEYAGHRVAIVAHRHGANVALEAAGRCHRQIDTLICLSAPHLYLITKDPDGERWPLPVYCSPSARDRIGKIVTLATVNDPVVNTFAELRKGLDEQTALTWTAEWRKRYDDPRLADDGGPIREWLEDVLKVTLSSNLIVSPHLSVGDHHLDIVTEADGLAPHAAIHSTRVGYVLGWLLHAGVTEQNLRSIRMLVLPADADDGNPLEPDAYRAWWTDHEPGTSFSGWVLKSLTVRSTQQSRPAEPGQRIRYWDFDHSWPDLYVRIDSVTGGDTLYCNKSQSVMDAQSMTWSPMFHVAREAAVRVMVMDDEPGFDDEMGSFVIDVRGADEPRATYRTAAFEAAMVWEAGHY